VARDKILKLRPDVLTLDVEMPRMDGLTFLSKLMQFHPMPVVVVSSLTPKNSEAAIRALELGAVEVIGKPGSAYSVPEIARQLVRAIRAAAGARIRKELLELPAVPSATRHFQLKTTDKVLAVGASTGGTKAIEVLLTSLPAMAPGTVIVQHMPEHFTAAFASRLNQLAAMEVREARDLDSVVTGVALIAPGHRHMVLERSGARYLVRLHDGPPVHHQRPSVDVLFHSVARSGGANAVGVLLTGMGADGAEGLLAMRESGSHTFAEDESSCVVFGMPREAIVLGAAVEVVALPRMAQAILAYLQRDA